MIRLTAGPSASWRKWECQELRATRGGEVLRIRNADELTAFLVPIDTPAEAVLLGAASRFTPTCSRSGTKARDGGFELQLFTHPGCDGRRRHLLFVSESGELRQLDSTLEEEPDPNCAVGRRPPGLRGAPRQRSVSAGAHFARSAELEAASVRAFEVLESELAAHRAPALHQARCARLPQVRRLYGCIAADEMRHAALAWDISRWVCAHSREGVRWRVRDGVRRAVEALRASAREELPNELVEVRAFPRPTLVLKRDMDEHRARGRVPFWLSVSSPARASPRVLSQRRCCGCHKMRAADTHTDVVDPSFRGNQRSQGLAQPSAVEAPTKRKPAFIMPRPAARGTPLLAAVRNHTERSTSVPPQTERSTSVPPQTERSTSVPPQTERSTSVPPPTSLRRPVGRAVLAAPAAPKQAARPASLPPSLPPVTNVPRPSVRATSVQPPVPTQAVRPVSLPPVSTIPRPGMRAASAPPPFAEEEPFELHRKLAAR